MEFGIPLEEVLSWPLKRTLQYTIFLRKWYKMKFGDPEEMEDLDIPSSMSGMKPKVPNVSKAKLKGMSKGRGASGHTYKFK